MRIGGTHYRTIWMEDDPGIVKVIDQRHLPFEFKVMDLRSVLGAHLHRSTWSSKLMGSMEVMDCRIEARKRPKEDVEVGKGAVA